VVSRPHATRELRILGSEGTIVMSDHEKCVRVSTHRDPEWRITPFTQGTVESGYINPEEPYIAEMADFVNAVKNGDPGKYPNTLTEDCEVLAILSDLENFCEKQS
jgi:predicted dehydrogenase